MNENDYGDYVHGRAALRLLEPWIVPEAIGFLKALFMDRPDFDIVEWGAGASTIWFCRNTFSTVYSIEQGQKWIDWVKERAMNTKLYYVPKTEPGVQAKAEHYFAYADAIFDILSEDHNVHFINVDGERRVRNRCIANAIEVLTSNGDGGIIMLDNSNWPDVQEGVALLKDWRCFDFDAPKHKDIPGGWRTSFYISPYRSYDGEW